MILDIKYVNGFPEQIQGVRMTTVYCRAGEPELVIQFQKYVSGPRYIPLREIHSVQTTND